MASQYILRGSLSGFRRSIPSPPFPSEGEALLRAAEIFDKYGSQVLFEIWLGDVSLFRDTNWMSHWNLSGRPLPPEE
jgi:hypothetical protein